MTLQTSQEQSPEFVFLSLIYRLQVSELILEELFKPRWPLGTPVAFHNFEFHTSLWISVRLLSDIRSFAAKGLSSVFLPLLWLYKWVFLFSARPLTQVL